VVEAKEGEMLEQGFRVKEVSDTQVTLVYEQIPDQPVIIAFTDPVLQQRAVLPHRPPLHRRLSNSFTVLP